MPRFCLLTLLALLASTAHAQSAPPETSGNPAPGDCAVWVRGQVGASPAAIGDSGVVGCSGAPSIASPSVVGNASGTTQAGYALNPLAVANMMSAVVSADVVATANVTLSGTQTIDSVAVAAGQVVFATAQTTTSQNGLWMVASGSWTRPVNFPTGYVIAQNCDLLIDIKLGTQYAGTIWYVPTASAAITIDTTGFTPLESQFYASTTKAGLVEVTGGSGSTAPKAAAFGGTVAASDDCTGFSGTTGSIGDEGDVNGNKGPCVVGSLTTGHIQWTGNYSGNPLGLTAPSTSAGSMGSNSSDNFGSITGLSAATTVTITFGESFTNISACVANDSAGTAVGISAISATAVTFTMTALTGSLYYHCFGTN
jgi:hypothetical protein